MRRKIEKILSPAINVKAEMVDAILAVFNEAVGSSDHAYVVSVGSGIILLEHGDIATTFNADQARCLAKLLTDGADILAKEKKEWDLI